MRITSARTAIAAGIAGSAVTAGTVIALRPGRYPDGKEGLTAGVPTHPWTTGNSAELLVEYEEFLPRLYTDLRAARQVINIVEYNWEPSGPGKQIADILKAKARSGVEVNVMTDKRGSMGIDSTTPAREAERYFEDLRSAGVNVIVTDPGGNKNPFGLELDHRKLFDIDHRVSYTGGLGIAGSKAGKYQDWHDLMLRLEGPASAQAGVEFLGEWRTAGGQVSRAQTDAFGSAMRAPGGQKTSGPATARMLPNTPGLGLDATDDFFRAASSDSRRLWTMTPYIGDRQVQAALIDAARAGKDVRVLVPGPGSKNNGPLLGISRTFYRDMIEAGVKVFEFPRMMHAKLWMTDDQVTVGSTNLSDGSIDEYKELSAAVRDPKTLRKAERMFIEDIRQSRQVTTSDFGTKDRVLEKLREVSQFEF